MANLGPAKPAVGIVVDVAQGDKSYGKFVKDRLMALASRSGKFTEAMGFEAFLNKELPKEMAQRDAQMKRGGTYYEPVARLAKRFGIPYACLVMVETDNDYGRISAVIGDANDETSLQVMNVESQGSKISNESLDNFISTVITYLSR